MPTCRLATLAAIFLSMVLSAAPDLKRGLIAHWDFNDGGGPVARDSSPSRNHARLINAQWATGPFGTALRLAGRKSYATFHAPRQLRGSEELSFSAWVMWEGTGQYPCIIHCGWYPGGFMMFVDGQSVMFRMGKPGKHPQVLKGDWKETSAMALAKLPMRQWTHLAATFKRPHLKVYVNGRQTGSAHWDYPVDFNADYATLGTWKHFEKSHEGLMDDIRLYNRQLSPLEVSQLASPDNRTAPDYRILPDPLAAKPILTAENNHATLTISADGTISSLKLKGNGRELLKARLPLVAIFRNKGLSNEPPILLERHDGDIITCQFVNPEDVVRLKVIATPNYFKIIPLDIRIQDLKSLVFCQVSTVLQTYFGSMLGMISDDRDALCFRSLGLRSTVSMHARDSRLIAHSESSQAQPVAIAAAPREHMPGILKDMQSREPVPKSTRGGAWTLESEETRASYLFADLRAQDTDQWIELARRGGFQVIHYHGWWKTLGHYDINDGYFPQGLKDMKKASDKIHAAGLQNTFHTLTACISTDDAWITPVPRTDLIPFQTYTLAQPMGEKDTAIVVKERPIDIHDRVFTYSGNGNAIQIGEEIILYSQISSERPYAFSNCTRGAFNTRTAPHPKGAKAHYLQQRYLAFYPQPDSQLADLLAQAIADKFNALNLDGLYFDGSEGMMSRYGIDAMRWNIFRRLKGAATSEASTWGHNNWWFHTRLGAWDYPFWSYRTNIDAHARHARNFPKSDLLRPQMGWWSPIRATTQYRAQFTDEFEYFAAKSHGIDSAMSLSGLRPGQENQRVLTQLTTLGWHERARLARYFTQEDRDQLAKPGQDVILRQDSQGRWRLMNQVICRRRLVSLKRGQADWQVRNPYDRQPLRLRIEALCVPDEKHPGEHPVLQLTRPSQMNVRDQAPGMALRTQPLPPDREAPFEKLKITASNPGNTARGAWIRLGNTYDFPYVSLKGCTTFGFWIKGDNSGAVLNLQFRTPPVYGKAISDHYVKLDFNGWKYVTLLLRERDADQMLDYAWPYDTNPASHATTRTCIQTDHLESVSIFLNNVPPQGTTTVEISDVRGFPQAETQLVNPRLTLNGQDVTFPVTLDSREYLELNESGQAEHFDPDGTLKARFMPLTTQPIMLREGLNGLSLAAPPRERPPRAEVTCFAVGRPFGTRSQNVNWTYLEREYEIPRTILKLDGIDNLWHVTRRDELGNSPNDLPKLECTLEVISAGRCDAQAQPGQKTQVDSLSDPRDFMPSKTNRYAKYAYDGEGSGTAKKGVTFTVSKARSHPSSDGAIQFSALSERTDSDGWAAIGKRFASPLNLQQAKTLTLNVRGNLESASLKIQLRDTAGAWHDMVTTAVSSTWETKAFTLADARLDLARIEYVLFFFNGLAPGQKATVTLDQLEAEHAQATLDNPTLTIAGQDVTFPCSLLAGDRLTCLDQKTWTVTTRQGTVKAQGTLQPPFPTLKPGANPVRLDFTGPANRDIRIRASLVKKY